jgi:hypothetical protein
MPLGPLGVTAALAGLDLGAWEWATSVNDQTLGLIAGLLMAPIAVAFAWSLVRVLFVLAQRALLRATAEPPPRSPADVQTPSSPPFDIERHDERLAA